MDVKNIKKHTKAAKLDGDKMNRYFNIPTGKLKHRPKTVRLGKKCRFKLTE